MFCGFMLDFIKGIMENIDGGLLGWFRGSERRL
jgi:hypothetical protein